ncbi:ATP adenylyltransferase-domain-containing protein [Chiua virens]|nr:ATP adenylyltransferase-domain-containing protein [Chiua virens]
MIIRSTIANNLAVSGGQNSGASQPHKHVQLIEVGPEDPPIEKLAKKATLEVSGKPFAISSLPYANHVFRLPTLSGDLALDKLIHALFPPFLSLLDLVISTVRHDPDYPAGPPSYNVILTLEHMHLIPRRHEAYKIKEAQELISVNSLGFAGMLLAKSESEMEAMKKEGIGRILRGVGLESVHELQVAGTSLEATEDVPLTSHTG